MRVMVPLAHPEIYGGRTSVELSLKWDTRRYCGVDPEGSTVDRTSVLFLGALGAQTHSLLYREQ